MVKKLKYSLAVLACLLLLPGLVLADGHLHTAQRKVTKKFTIAKGVQLSLNNQFGNMVIQSWKQKSVVVQITITGKSAKLKRANDLVWLVTIKSRKASGALSLETAIDTQKRHIDPLIGEQCHINYLVFVPRGLKLSVTNRFGDIHVKSFNGDLNVDEKFGDLKVEHTTGPVNFNVEQGNADIDRLRNGSLMFKGFTHVQIGELSGTLDAKFWSGGKVDLGLTGDLQKLNINADNVKPLNITNLKPANVNLKIHSMLSKIIHNGQIMINMDKKLIETSRDKDVNVEFKKPLKIDTVFITGMGKGDTTQKTAGKPLTLKLKLNKIKIMAMKNMDYTLKTGSATTDVRIDASFSVVNIKD